jgi:glutathionylspermidine synthase
MERVANEPRPGWRELIREHGLIFPVDPDEEYWTEDAHYRFTYAEVEKIELATAELHAMCLEAVDHVIRADRFADLHIPADAVPLIRQSWEEEPPSLYGRFDLAFDGVGNPKMLEYNADTPTSLLEASVIQWNWLRAVYPAADQFNSIHERLVDVWRNFSGAVRGGNLVTFSCIDDVEDVMTVTYLQDSARQAGFETSFLGVTDIGWNGWQFIDLEDRPLGTIFKLYPWEWMFAEFPAGLQGADTQWIEPAWKMILSNKGILPILWEMFPHTPYLLEASFDAPSDEMKDWGYAKKPFLSREGANVTLRFGELDNRIEVSGGDYGAEGFIYQALAKLPDFQGRHPVIGSWIIGQEPAGMGIRETTGLITNNTSRFVPHMIL